MSVSNSATPGGWLKSVIVALGIGLAVVAIFGAGFVVGRQTAFPARAFQNPSRAENRSGHGAIGAIQSIEGQRITVLTRDSKVQIILVDENTRLERKFQKASLTDFQVNDQIVAIGSPNAAGEIQARLVGIVDPSFRPPRLSPGFSDSK